jgi:hypothetical protein
VLHNELRDHRLDFLSRDHMAAHATDVGLGRLHEAPHELWLGGEDVRLIGKDVWGVGQRDMLERRGGEAIEIIAALVVFVKRNQLGLLVGRTFGNGHAPVSFHTMTRPHARG